MNAVISQDVTLETGSMIWANSGCNAGCDIQPHLITFRFKTEELSADSESNSMRLLQNRMLHGADINPSSDSITNDSIQWCNR